MRKSEPKLTPQDIYVFGDCHFGHPNIIEYCGRPEDHEDLIIRGFSGLNKRPVVVCLGDVAFGNKNQELVYHKRLLEAARSIAGYTVLIRGNHDKRSNKWYAEEAGWDASVHEWQAAGCIFTHIPLKKPKKLNICGHQHNKVVGIANGMWPMSRLYSPEVEGYVPVPLEDAITFGTKEMLYKRLALTDEEIVEARRIEDSRII